MASQKIEHKEYMSCEEFTQFQFFHKPYQVLEFIPYTEYLSPESQKSHFWKLQLGIITVQKSSTCV